MKKLNPIGLRLPEKTINKIKHNASRNKQRFSDYLRNLIELGLCVEALKDSLNLVNERDAFFYKAFLKSSLLASALTHNSPHIDQSKKELLLSVAETRARQRVAKYFGDDSPKINLDN